MRLVANWRQVLGRGYSAWCIYAAIAVHLVDTLVPYVLPFVADSMPLWLSTVVLGLMAIALMLRVVKQVSVSGATS